MAPLDRPANLQTPAVFISCTFPPTGLSELCAQIVSALGLTPIMADRAAPEDPRDKVSDLMSRCRASIFVLDLSLALPSTWQGTELGYALSLGHRLAFIYHNPNKHPVDFHNPARDIEPLILARDPDSTESHVAIVSYLASLKAQVERDCYDSLRPADPIRYDSAIWAVKVSHSGYISYAIRHECVAQDDGVGDFDHWMNVNVSLPPPIRSRQPSVKLSSGATGGKKITVGPLIGDDRVFRFGIRVNPPLRYEEHLTYEYQVVTNYGPITRAWYKVESKPIVHMYTVTHPMHLLVLSVISSLGVPFSEVRARSYVGQRMDVMTENRREAARAQQGLHHYFAAGQAIATLEVRQPLVGYTYALEWVPDWRS